MKRLMWLFFTAVIILGLSSCGEKETTGDAAGSYWDVNVCYTEDGLLYFDPHSEDRVVCFFDYETKEYFPLCAKSNCLHDSEECTAYRLWGEAVTMGRLGDKWYRVGCDGDFNGTFYSMDLDGENERQIGPFSQFPFGVFGKSLFYEDKCILATNEADFDPETGEILGVTSGIYRYHLDSGEAENLCPDITSEKGGQAYSIWGMYDNTLVYLQWDSRPGQENQVLKLMNLETKEISEPLGDVYVYNVDMNGSVMACNVQDGDGVRILEYDMVTGEAAEVAGFPQGASLFWSPELKLCDVTEGRGDEFRFQMYRYKDGESVLVREGGEEDHFLPTAVHEDIVIGQAGKDWEMAYMETEDFLQGRNNWTILEYGEEEASPEETVRLKCLLFSLDTEEINVQGLNRELEAQGLPYEVEFESPHISFEGDYKAYVDAYADLAASGDYDLVHCAGSMNGYVVQEALAGKGILFPLRERLEDSSEGRRLMDAYPENVWEALSCDGEIYGAPTLGGDYRYYAVFNTEYAEKYGIAPEDIRFQELDGILRTAAEGERASGNAHFVGAVSFTYLLQGRYEYSRCELICVDTGEGVPRAESIVENDAFISWIKTLNSWRRDGILRTDMSRQVVQGNFFMTGVYSYSPEAAVAAARAEHNISDGVKLAAVELPELSRGALYKTTDVMGVSAQSAHRDEAFELLSALYTNEELANILAYGEENVDYAIEDGRAVMLEEGTQSERLIQELQRRSLGNTLITLPGEWDSLEKREELWEAAKELETSVQEQLIYSDELKKKIAELSTWLMDEHSFILSGESEDIEADLERIRQGAWERGCGGILEEMNLQYQAGGG